jgi:predicted DNA-binding mobile mystery protein A
MALEAEFRARVRRDLEEEVRVFRNKRVRRGKWGWLRGVRQAIGVEVTDVAERMGVCRSEVYRLERSEAEDTISLGRLREAAGALGCELVYAVVPMRGSLEELAEDAVAARVRRREKKREELPGRGEGKDAYGLAKTIRSVLKLAGWDSGR